MKKAICAIGLALRSQAWRQAALAIAAVAVGICGLELIAGIVSGEDRKPELKRAAVPSGWLIADPVLGYRPAPNTNVLDTAWYGDELVYRVFYSIDETGARTTPTGRPDADTYLFLGDSFIFGQGLNDSESLPAQLTMATAGAIRGINRGVPGYGPNHLVRALETGEIERLAYQNLRAVVTWIIPAQLARVVGDGAWLESSPRYVLSGGLPEYTGSFAHNRWTSPAAGIAYLLQSNFAFARAIGARQQQLRQRELFLSLVSRLADLVRVRLNVPLIVIYSWPDEESHPNYSDWDAPQAFLVDTIVDLRRRGIELVSMNNLIVGQDPARLLIAHDGHPTAFSNGLLARELGRKAMTTP